MPHVTNEQLLADAPPWFKGVVDALPTELTEASIKPIRKIVLDAYNEEHGTTLSLADAFEGASSEDVLLWYRKTGGSAVRFLALGAFGMPLHDDLGSSINLLAQRHCNVCTLNFPILVIPLPVAPQSHQSMDGVNRAQYRAGVVSALTKRERHKIDFPIRCCMSITFALHNLNGRRWKDLANMAKCTVDATIGLLIDNDEQIDHLDLAKVRHSHQDECMFLQYAPIKQSASDKTRTVLWDRFEPKFV